MQAYLAISRTIWKDENIYGDSMPADNASFSSHVIRLNSTGIFESVCPRQWTVLISSSTSQTMPFCLNREPAGDAVLNGSMTASNHIVNMMVEYHADVALTHLASGTEMSDQIALSLLQRLICKKNFRGIRAQF